MCITLVGKIYHAQIIIFQVFQLKIQIDVSHFLLKEKKSLACESKPKELSKCQIEIDDIRNMVIRL